MNVNQVGQKVPGNRSLGMALRQLRERTEPNAVGLSAVGRRRARGLRREELAELAGVSADYIRRLEQGRRHPSPGVVNAIARALRVELTEYERLCVLAGYAAADGQVPREVRPGALRLLERLDAAVCLCDAAWNVVAWNSAWARLRCGEPTGHAWDGNVAWRTFGEAPGRVSRTAKSATSFETMLAARLRMASLRYPADTSLAALVDEMRGTSRKFDRLWHTAGTVGAHEDRAVLSHPGVGELTLDCDLLAVPDGDLLAMIFTTRPGSADAARLGEIAGNRPGLPTGGQTQRPARLT